MRTMRTSERLPLMSLRETLAVYCRNGAQHVSTACGQDAEFSSCSRRQEVTEFPVVLDVCRTCPFAQGIK
jgi:hypothetical protein